MTAPLPLAWPPTVHDLRRDLGQAVDEGRPEDEAVLSDMLAAAIAKVIELRGGTLNLTGNVTSPLPGPGADLALGTVRLAGRWYTRRRSPDGLVSAGDLGSTRVPSYDPDIERLLKVGRYALPVIA